MNAAVIYYSKAGTTRKIAERIAATFNADLFFVEPEIAYGSYISAVIRVAGEKIRKKDPALKSKIADFSSYDTVFIGFPVWYGIWIEKNTLSNSSTPAATAVRRCCALSLTRSA